MFFHRIIIIMIINILHSQKAVSYTHLDVYKRQEQLTKNTFSMEFEVPENLKSNFQFEAGQYVTLKYPSKGEIYYNDFSMTSAPYEEKIACLLYTSRCV